MHNLTDLFLESKGAGDWETHLTNYLKIHARPAYTVPDVSATGLYQRNCASTCVVGTSDSFPHPFLGTYHVLPLMTTSQ